MPLQDWIQPYPHVAALLQHEDAVLLDRPEGAAALDVHAACRVVYPRAADNVSRPLPYRLSAARGSRRWRGWIPARPVTQARRPSRGEASPENGSSHGSTTPLFLHQWLAIPVTCR
jgi:hypothetical protein